MISLHIKLVIFIAYKVNVRSMQIGPNKVLIYRSSAVSDDSTPVSHTIDNDNHRHHGWNKLILEKSGFHFFAMIPAWMFQVGQSNLYCWDNAVQVKLHCKFISWVIQIITVEWMHVLW